MIRLIRRIDYRYYVVLMDNGKRLCSEDYRMMCNNMYVCKCITMKVLWSFLACMRDIYTGTVAK